ncbi:hypothetical protein GYMLUDRAFT_67140 [Collybiopsis luxurians FD-317 M1]|nr:hypothetical protein GYMLUDRAFT_67140 [Collybiopsis luxurians FD-317 M1]
MSASLQKGSACINCRSRCDGQKPRCGPCLNSSGAFSDCEYSDVGTTQLQSLENQVSILEARLQELQSGSSFSPKDSEKLDLQKSGSEVYLNPPPSANTVGFSSSGFEHLPPVVHEMLMHNFIHKTCSLGFFLQKEKFTEAVFRPDVGTVERPTFALLNASYLWGIHLSSSQTSPDQEAILVSRALQSSAHALSENHSQSVLQCVQSEVLLANYFYRAGRIVEGRYHGTAAASLVLSSGLHKARTPSLQTSGYLAAFFSPLAPPRDAIEEGERINAFWTVLILDTFWNAVYGIPSSIPYTTPMVRVDCPWPRIIDEYEKVPFGPEYQSSQTIERFLSGIPDDNNSPKASFAKAAILFERATMTGLLIKSNPNMAQYQTSFDSLNAVIQSLTESLSPLHRGSHPPLDYQVCMTSLVHAATIRLHLPFASQSGSSRIQSLRAAKSIVDLIDDWNDVPEMEFIDPMLAIIWALCCRVLIDEGARLQMSENNADAPLFPPTDVRSFCERVISVMEMRPFPLMSYQLAQIRAAFARTYE